ncbi:5917_t:CDS:2 [Paraglomus occultum]|uniref:5917_t:CDS:1 n=1 Tax=Paraglomus occultum TaxID=144539 RepID=A0A9N8ZPG4_9GLOM|nr:5917_t:CDS:2 [Paraglomus occultum]
MARGLKRVGGTVRHNDYGLDIFMPSFGVYILLPFYQGRTDTHQHSEKPNLFQKAKASCADRPSENVGANKLGGSKTVALKSDISQAVSSNVFVDQKESDCEVEKLNKERHLITPPAKPKNL